MMVRGFLPSPAPGDIVYSPISVAVDIAEGLAAKKHTVTFFGPEGTELKANIDTLGVQPLAENYQELVELASSADLFEDYIPSLYDQYMARNMFERAKAGEFDVLVFHHSESSIGYTKLFPNVPVVYILHDYLDENRRKMFEMHQSKNQHFVSISNNQRRNAPDLPYIGTVYNGIDTNLFAYSEKSEDYLLFVGRIVQDKGVREAVQVAVRTKKQLLIIGQLPPTSYSYFDEHIKPYLSDKILYLGAIDKEQLAKYYQKAQALLMPIQWEEPFGLTMAEAMSCGTPVIAFNRGSASEVIKDGKTGFVIDNTAQMIEAVEKIKTISRKDCRSHAERYFTVDHMVENYEKLLSGLVVPATKSSKQNLVKKLKTIFK